MAKLLYGSGLRLMECVRLRVKDEDGYDIRTVPALLGHDNLNPTMIYLPPARLVVFRPESSSWAHELSFSGLIRHHTALSALCESIR